MKKDELEKEKDELLKELKTVKDERDQLEKDLDEFLLDD